MRLPKDALASPTTWALLMLLSSWSMTIYGYTEPIQRTLSTNAEMALTLRALRSLLRRLDVELAPPFRDFTTFHDYWSRNGMSGGSPRSNTMGASFDGVFIKYFFSENR